jgi:hypothetical protein
VFVVQVAPVIQNGAWTDHDEFTDSEETLAQFCASRLRDNLESRGYVANGRVVKRECIETEVL